MYDPNAAPDPELPGAEAPAPLKLVGLDVIQADLFTRARHAVQHAKDPADARARLEKLGAVFSDGKTFMLAGIQASLAGDPAGQRRRSAQARARKQAKAARKARREARRG